MNPPLVAAWRVFADAWLPRDCALCDTRLAAREAGLCSDCLRELPGGAAPRCPCCGLKHADAPARCAACRHQPPAFDRTVVLADYAAPLDALIQAFKFRGELALGSALGASLAPRLAIALADLPAPAALVPIPLAPLRLAGRGYNQCEAIARAVARPLRLPVAPRLLLRDRETAAQSTLALEQRRGNLVAALRAPPSATGRHLVVVDDVMTTGATLQAAAQALKTAGAATVINLVVARTP